jgi:hypothetical protein
LKDTRRVPGEHRVDVARVPMDDDGVRGGGSARGGCRCTTTTTTLVRLDGVGVARRQGRSRRCRRRRGRTWLCGGLAPVGWCEATQGTSWPHVATEETPRPHMTVRGRVAPVGCMRRRRGRRGRPWLCGGERRRRGHAGRRGDRTCREGGRQWGTQGRDLGTRRAR